MNHSFNIEIAAEYGLHEAIILENLFFWIRKNMANGTNYLDGHYWTYNSVKAFTELFPYMTGSMVRRTLERLENKELIITGNYNEIAYDRTKWYALTDKALALYGVESVAPAAGKEGVKDADFSKCICQKQQMNLSGVTNEFVNYGKPIPDINTDITTDKNNNGCVSVEEVQEPEKKPETVSPVVKNYPKDFEMFWKVYPRRKEKAGAYKMYCARLNDGFSSDEMLTAARAYAAQCQREHTEQKFIKLAKTFLGPATAFTDFLPKMNQEMARRESMRTDQIDDDVMRQFEQLMEVAT